MADEGFKRKLAAILSADVEGYSRLMDDNEEATVRTLTAYRTAITNLVQQFRGRIVDTPGDNILAEFISVVDSVNCAAEIQRDIAERNAELPNNRRMQFRIGVNLGDVIEEEGRIYGDGVNIAARVEAMAETGGICISGRVYDQVANKLELEYEYLGEQQVKNIRTPIRVYRLLSYPGAAAHRVVQTKESLRKRWRKTAISAAVVAVIAVGLGIWQFYQRRPSVEPASIEKMALPLPEKPSIAVLPFDNMSDDPKQEYFSDGITEEIISALSKTDQLFVIARNSTFTYKGKPVKVKQVAEELGVRYVLEGSVRKSEDRVRITAQLIDATKGYHLWSERYDRKIKDIFELQDEITMKIITALQVKLTEGEQMRMWAKRYKTLDVQLKAMELLSLWRKGTVESSMRHGQVAQEVIDMAPDQAVGYRGLGWHHWFLALIGKSPRENLKKAFEMAQKAISLDEFDGLSHALLGSVYSMMRQHEKAIAAGERATELDPNVAQVHLLFGQTLHYAGRQDKAIDYINNAIRLNPYPPYFYFSSLGLCYLMRGESEKALTGIKKALQFAPDSPPLHANLAVTYILLDREEEARASAAKALELFPRFSVTFVSKNSRYKNQTDIKLIVDALREAGFPEQTALPKPDKPSIAVLPFVNMSGDPEQEYFSDGMTDDIITDLSKISGLMVISSSSTFTYKGKEIRIPVIAKELGVKYVLEGSVRRAGNEVRINAQLIDADTDHHIWANRFDGKNESIFALQDKITERIVSALAVKLSASEQKVMADKGTDNIVAYDTFLKGMSHMRKYTPKDLVKAIEYFEKATELDPIYSEAYANIAHTYMSALHIGKKFWDESGIDFPTSRLLARNYVEKAMKHPTSRGYQVMAILELYKRNFEEAIDNAEHAVSISPNDADALYTLGRIMVYVGKPEEGLKYYKRSIMLDPLHKSTDGIGFAYLVMGNYEQAVKYGEKYIKDYSENYGYRALLAVAYAYLGNDIKAKKAFEEFYT